MRETTAILVTLLLLHLAVAAEAANVPEQSVSPAVTIGAPDPGPNRPSFDLETDPVALFFRGGSLHAGIWFGQWRLDVGGFGMEMPESLHGNDGYTARFDGGGLKLDRTFGRRRSHVFAGVDTSVSRLRVTNQDDDAVRNAVAVTFGGRVGYRAFVGDHFFLAPWVGVAANLPTSSIDVGGGTFDRAPVTVFPTVHLGYSF